MNPRSTMRATVAFVADDALVRALVRASDKTGRSRSNIARYALAEHLRATGFLKPSATGESTA